MKPEFSCGFAQDDILLIEWVDQNSYVVQHPAKGALSRAVGFTLGYFLEEDAEWICIAMEKMIIDDKTPEYRHIVSFPKVCIKHCRKFAIGDVIPMKDIG